MKYISKIPKTYVVLCRLYLDQNLKMYNQDYWMTFESDNTIRIEFNNSEHCEVFNHRWKDIIIPY